MALEVASLFGVLALEDRLTPALSGARSALDSFAGNLQSAGQQVSSMGVSLTTLTAPLLAFGATGLNTAATFDQAMIEISARTGLVGEDLERVRQTALQMGSSTVFSAQQSADAFLQLLSSGQDVEQALSTLPLVLTGAAASGEDLGKTADALTDIMATFGVQIDRLPPDVRALADSLGVTNQALYDFSEGADPGDMHLNEIPPAFREIADAMDMSAAELYDWLQDTEDASTIIDSMTRAAGASSATIASLTEGMAAGGATMAMFGFSVDASNAYLAIMEERGIKGANAGTAIKSMLLNMAQNTKPVQAAWDRLGISMYDAEGNMRDMRTVLFELDRALDTLPVEDQNILMQTLAGSYGITALAAARGEVSIGDMQESMEDQASAADVAAKMMEAFNIRIDTLKGSVESLQTEAMTPFMNDVLGPFIERATGVINSITEWVKVNPELTSQIVMTAGAVAALGPVLIVVGQSMTALGAVIAALTSPIGLVVAAVAGFAAAWMTDFLGIRTFVETSVFPALQDFFFWLQGVWVSLQPGLEALRLWFIADALPSIVNFIQSVVAPAFELVIGIIADIWNAVAPPLTAFFEWFMVYGLPVITDFINGIVVPVIDSLIQIIAGIWNAVRPYVQPFVEGITGALRTVISVIRDVIGWVSDAIDKIRDLLGLNSTVQSTDFSVRGSSVAMVNNGQVSSSGGFGGTRDSGGMGSAGTPYLIGTGAQPELFVPSTAGSFYPAGQYGNGITIQGDVVIQANSYAEGQQAADGFDARMRELRTRNG